MNKAAGYIRVSTAAQAKEGESLSTQQQEIEEYCRQNKLELVGIYSDEGVSGKLKKRPQLTALLKDSAQGKFEVVIVTRLTRFGRSARDLLNNLAVIEENKVNFVSLKERIDTSIPAGRLLRTVLAGIAEFEHDVIFEQMNENKMALLRRNEIFIGKPPYGYTFNKKTKQMEINPEEAAIYKRIVDMYLNHGKSFSDIGIQLREEGIKCKQAFFHSSTISYILRNPAYYGNYVLNQRKYKDGKRLKEFKPVNEHVPFPIEPLISKADWDRIQEKVKFNTSKIKRITTTKDLWLRDMLECGLCGGAIRPHHGPLRNDGTSQGYYSCFWATRSQKQLKAGGRKNGHLPTIKANELEHKVLFAIVQYMTFGGYTLKGKYHPAKIEEMVSLQQYEERIASLEMQKKGLQAVLKRKELSKDRLYVLLEMDDYDPQDFNTKYREVTAEIEKLTSQITETQEKLATLQASKDQQEALKKFVQENQEWLKGIRKDLFKLSPEDKKLFVETLVQSKIKISLEYVDEAGVDNWNAEIPGFRFNPSIFEHLMEKGKILVSKPALPDHFGPPDCRQG